MIDALPLWFWLPTALLGWSWLFSLVIGMFVRFSRSIPVSGADLSRLDRLDGLTEEGRA